MGERLYSDYWYRVNQLKPRLRSYVKIHRHTYRGKLWFVLENTSSGKNYRLSEQQYAWVGKFNGQHSFERIWDQACEELGDHAPTQDQAINLLSQLHKADIVLCDCMPDLKLINSQRAKNKRKEKLKRWMEPFCWRFPLYDPSRLLSGSSHFARHLFSTITFYIWASVVLTASILAMTYWEELSDGVLDKILSAKYALWLLMFIPLLKIIHELGHALAVVRGGGQVREVGIMLIAFVPLPYVDASASATFPEKKDRILVAAAGMAVEVFIASICLIIWCLVEPGVIRGALYSLVLAAGIATLLFNLNPLLRFDAYYILSDWIEVPNLCTRSRLFLTTLIKRQLLRLKHVEIECLSVSEKVWLISYGILSIGYRFIIFASIIFFVWNKFFFLGVILALWGGISLLVLPMIRGMGYLLFHPELGEGRRRACVNSGLLALSIIISLTFIPFPKWTFAEGVVVPADESVIRAETFGFVAKIIAEPDSQVSVGDPLLVCDQPGIEESIKIIQAEIAELEAERIYCLKEDLHRVGILEEEIKYHQKRLQRELEKSDSLILKSRMDGRFVLPKSEDLLGRYITSGSVVGHVLNPDNARIRVIVPQKYVDQVRNETVEIQFKLSEMIESTYRGNLLRELPGASNELPSSALGTLGGGSFAIDPNDSTGIKTIEKFFEFELGFQAEPSSLRLGGKVFVRFEHSWEPLVYRWYRNLSELFLGRLHV